MKNKWLIMFLGILILLLIIFVIPRINKSDYSLDDNYLIHYYNGSLVYDIETKRNEMIIKKSEVIVCTTIPCDPILKNRYEVKYKDEYIKFIQELFKDKEKKEITIQDKDLNSKQIDILSKIIK